MGDSAPPEAVPVNLWNSFALRRGGQVEVVLADPQPPLDAEGVRVVLRRDGERLPVAGTVVDDDRGRRLIASFAASDLADGQWQVVVRAAGQRILPGVRLLVQGDRPVVLLWGNRPTRPEVEVGR